jgi:hypothetical protein
MIAHSEEDLPEAVRDAFSRMTSELDGILLLGLTCEPSVRRFVEIHVDEIRHRFDLDPCRAEVDPDVPIVGEEPAKAILFHTRRIRRTIEEIVLPWCGAPPVSSNPRLRAAASLLAAVYALEFPLELQHPDLADKGPDGPADRTSSS